MKVKSITHRRSQIAHTAAELIGQKGYAAVSVRTLADAVGLETSSIYSHFSSKEEILWEIATACADDFQQTLEPIFHSNLHTREKLSRMLAAHVEVTLRNRVAAPVFVNEWRHLGEPQRSEFAARRDTYERMFREVVRQGLAERVFRELDARLAVLTLLSALNSTAQWYRPEGELMPDEIGEQLAHMLLYGLIQSF